MQNNWKKYSRYLFYSFPLQLLVLHIKKHPFFLLFWLVFFGAVMQFIGVSYGIPLLFLDPEYLGKVDFISFLLVGFAMGGFIMAWNISFYILNSYRFEFLASLSNPFVQFCWNNSIIPVTFTVTYIIQLVRFQNVEGLVGNGQIAANVAALLLGNILMIVFTSIFFIIFNQDIETFVSRLSDKAKSTMLLKNISLDKLQQYDHDAAQWKVETYVVFPLSVHLVRKADFYDRKLVDKILFLHHRNAFLFQILAILGLAILGWLMENPYFRLPAGTTLFFVFSILAVLFSYASYFFRGWKTVAVIGLIIVLNVLTKYDLVVYKHKIYGLDYTTEKTPYNNEAIHDAVSDKMVQDDIQSTQRILNNWHKKIKSKYGTEKPKLILINTAGGGLKSTYWTFHVMQELEKSLDKKLMDHTVLITGASGGMIGAAYFRELFLRQKNHEAVDYLHKSYLDDAGLDLLNAVSTSIATNDIFYPWQEYRYQGLEYKKDRAYMFNKQLNENTHYMMYKLMTDYRKPEQKAQIPMMIVGATIINDQRFLFFSPQSISYMIRPFVHHNKSYLDNIATDAVEYMRFFEDKGAANLNFIDALRANATYPYILPAVYLPTSPPVKVMDAGIRENSGFSVSTRFYSVFREWIETHTSGVIFISIRVDNKLREFDVKQKESYISELVSPVGNILNNFILLQEYNSDMSLAYLKNAGNTNISVLDFNYDQTSKRKKASMSWHLTALEKQDIQQAFDQENNQKMLSKLKELME
jgi:hypothetical protein